MIYIYIETIASIYIYTIYLRYLPTINHNESWEARLSAPMVQRNVKSLPHASTPQAPGEIIGTCYGIVTCQVTCQVYIVTFLYILQQLPQLL